MNPQDLQNLLNALDKFKDQLGDLGDSLRTAAQNAANNNNQNNQNSTRVYRDWSKLSEVSKKLTDRLQQNIDLEQQNTNNNRRYERSVNANEKAVDNFRRSINESSGQFASDLKTGKLSLNQFREQIDNVKKDLDANTNLSQKQKDNLKQELDSFEKRVRVQSSFNSVMDEANTIMKVFGPAFSAASSGLLKMISAYQSSSAGLSVNLAGFNASVGIGQGLLNGLGTAAMAAGTYLGIKLPGYFKLFGAGLAAGGAALMSTASVLEKLKPVFDMLGSELNRQIEFFDKISSTGAAFANGIVGMRDAASRAGMDLGTFSSILKDNQESFIQSGLGMQQAVVKFSRSMDVVVTSGLRKSLFNLGYSVEQQGQLMANVFEQLGRNGRIRATDEKEIARLTGEYGKNLRVLSDITGADAQKRMQEANKEMQTVSLRARVREMEAAGNKLGADKLQAALATVPKDLLIGIEQKLNPRINRVVDPELLALIQRNPEIGKAIDQTVADIRNQKLPMDEMIPRLSDALNKMYKGFSSKEAVALSDISALGKFADPMVKSLAELQDRLSQATQRFLPYEEAKQAGKAVEEQGKTTDKTTVTLGKLRDLEMEMRKQIQDKILTENVLGKFADGVVTTTETIKAAIDRFNKEMPGGVKTGIQAEKPETEKPSVTASNVTAGVIGGRIGSVIGGLLGIETGPGALATAALGGIIGTKIGDAISETKIGESFNKIVESIVQVGTAGIRSIYDMIMGAPKFAQGGIMEASQRGRLAMLHGREAVIPLDKGSDFLNNLIDKRLATVSNNAAIVDAINNLAQEQRQAFTFQIRTLPDQTTDAHIANMEKINNVIANLVNTGQVEMTRGINQNIANNQQQISNIFDNIAKAQMASHRALTQQTLDSLNLLTNKSFTDLNSVSKNIIDNLSNKINNFNLADTGKVGDTVQKELTDRVLSPMQKLIENNKILDPNNIISGLMNPIGAFANTILSGLINNQTVQSHSLMESIVKLTRDSLDQIGMVGTGVLSSARQKISAEPKIDPSRIIADRLQSQVAESMGDVATNNVMDPQVFGQKFFLPTMKDFMDRLNLADRLADMKPSAIQMPEINLDINKEIQNNIANFNDFKDIFNKFRTESVESRRDDLMLKDREKINLQNKEQQRDDLLKEQRDLLQEISSSMEVLVEVNRRIQTSSERTSMAVY